MRNAVAAAIEGPYVVLCGAGADEVAGGWGAVVEVGGEACVEGWFLGWVVVFMVCGGCIVGWRRSVEGWGVSMTCLLSARLRGLLV